MEQYDNAGQVCLSGTRLLVEEPVRDAFTEKFLARAARLRQGDPRDEATDIGPLIHAEHVARVDGFVQRAKADGATVLLGGGRNTELGGLYYRPTLFTDVKPGAEIATEEVFGPVLVLDTFSDRGRGGRHGERHRLRPRRDRLHRRCGPCRPASAGSSRAPSGSTASSSATCARRSAAPGSSGVGREGGTWSFDFFCDVKNSVFSPNGWTTATSGKEA